MGRHLRSGFWIFLAIFIFVCFSGHSVAAESRKPKNVQVALRAKWPGTSILLEAGYVLSKKIYYPGRDLNLSR